MGGLTGSRCSTLASRAWSVNRRDGSWSDFRHRGVHCPELLIGDGSVTPAGDLYALGILFHDAIVGRPPFSGRLEIVLSST